MTGRIIKVWRVKANVWNHLPLPLPVETASKPLYSLYEKRNGQYVRIATNAYPIKAATIVFSARLAQKPLERSIRQVHKFDLNEAR